MLSLPVRFPHGVFADLYAVRDLCVQLGSVRPAARELRIPNAGEVPRSLYVVGGPVSFIQTSVPSEKLPFLHL